MEKDDKGSTLIRIGVSGESSFWYRPTRVVPDQRPLNGRCCHILRECIEGLFLIYIIAPSSPFARSFSDKAFWHAFVRKMLCLLGLQVQLHHGGMRVVRPLQPASIAGRHLPPPRRP